MAEATISDGTITSNATTKSAEGIVTYGNVNMSGGKIITNGATGSYGIFAYNGTTEVSGSAEVSSTATAGNARAINAYSTGTFAPTLNLKGGTVSAETTESGTAYSVYVAPKTDDATPKANISGGYYKVAGNDYGMVNVLSNTEQISISGGYFNKKNNLLDSYIADGYGIYDVTDDTYKYEVAQNVAQIGDINYAYLSDAINAASSSTQCTIKLLANLSGLWNINGKNIILDLNGHTLSGSGNPNYSYVLGVIYGANVSVKNGTIKQDYPKGYALLGLGSDLTVEKDVTIIGPMAGYGIWFGNGEAKTLNINGATIKSRGWAVNYSTYDGSKINIDGATIEGIAGVFGNGNKEYSKNIVTIKNSSITATYDEEVDSVYSRNSKGEYNGDWALAQALYFPNNDSVNVSNTTINVNGGQGVVARAGTVILENDTITVTGTKVGSAGDKDVDLQSAVVVFDATKPNYPGLTETEGVATVNITGGTYICDQSVEAVQVVRDANATNTGKYIEVSGGTFSSAVNEDYCAADYVPTFVDGKYTVGEANESNAVSYTTTEDWLTEKSDSRTYITGSKIALTDNDSLATGKYWSFKVPVQKEGQTITYTRTFSNNNDQGWFVPFSVNVEDYKDQVRFYEIAVTTSGEIRFSSVDAGTIKANQPYVVRSLQSEPVTIVFTSSDSILYATNDSNEFSLSSNDYSCLIKGVYTSKPVTASDNGWYTLSSKGNLSLRNGVVKTANLTLKPFRWFLSNVKLAGSKSALSIIHSDDDVTGINSVNSTVENSTNVIYDLQGHRVNNPEKGIYIINGKKVLVK